MLELREIKSRTNFIDPFQANVSVILQKINK